MESLAGPVTQILWKPQRFASPLCFCLQGCLFCTTNYILVGVKPLIWSTPPQKKNNKDPAAGVNSDGALVAQGGAGTEKNQF